MHHHIHAPGNSYFDFYDVQDGLELVSSNDPFASGFRIAGLTVMNTRFKSCSGVQNIHAHNNSLGAMNLTFFRNEDQNWCLMNDRQAL